MNSITLKVVTGQYSDLHRPTKILSATFENSGPTNPCFPSDKFVILFNTDEFSHKKIEEN